MAWRRRAGCGDCANPKLEGAKRFPRLPVLIGAPSKEVGPHEIVNVIVVVAWCVLVLFFIQTMLEFMGYYLLGVPRVRHGDRPLPHLCRLARCVGVLSLRPVPPRARLARWEGVPRLRLVPPRCRPATASLLRRARWVCL